MGNVAPKGTNRFDDDADFGASFVLSRGEVDDALSSGAQPSGKAEAPMHPAPSRKKLLYACAAVAAALLLIAVALLAL